MIYHISFPHHPFIQNYVNRFEENNPNNNKVILITTPENEKNRCDIDNKLILYKGALTSEVIKMVNSKECTGVCIYWLNEDLLDLALQIDNRKSIFWRSFGPDLHDILYDNKDQFYDFDTIKIIDRFYYLHSIKKTFKPIYEIFKKNDFKKNYNKKVLRFLERINFIGTVTSLEYEMLSKKVSSMSAELIISSSASNSFKIPFNVKDSFEKNILIGHSSFPLHNHMSVFKMLKSFGAHNSKLIVPLSYGIKEYAEKIMAIGSDMFGARFFPLIEYLPIDKYLELTNTCSSFILNSYVQQGSGNIHRLLLTGRKVYLHEKNPIYLERKKQGIKIFSVQKDLSKDHLYNYHLSQNEISENREILVRYLYNKDTVNEKITKIINSLSQ